jgi:hypothetical protein
MVNSSHLDGKYMMDVRQFRKYTAAYSASHLINYKFTNLAGQALHSLRE